MSSILRGSEPDRDRVRVERIAVDLAAASAVRKHRLPDGRSYRLVVQVCTGAWWLTIRECNHVDEWDREYEEVLAAWDLARNPPPPDSDPADLAPPVPLVSDPDWIDIAP